MEKKKMPLPKLDDLFLEHDGDRPIEKIIDINIEEIDEYLEKEKIEDIRKKYEYYSW